MYTVAVIISSFMLGWFASSHFGSVTKDIARMVDELASMRRQQEELDATGIVDLAQTPEHKRTVSRVIEESPDDDIEGEIIGSPSPEEYARMSKAEQEGAKRNGSF